MTRLTRKDMQQQTRERLIAAAEAEIARQGIEGASIRDISEAAGYSLGAFYSNFASKRSLLDALLERHMRDEIRAFGELVSGTNGTGMEQVLAKIALWLRQMQRNKTLTALAVEFHLHANRDAAFKKAFEKSKAARHAELAEGLKALFDRFGRKPAIDPLQMANGLAALWVGFAVHGTDAKGQSADEVILFFLRTLLSSASPAEENGEQN